MAASSVARVASLWRSRTLAKVVCTFIRGLSDDAGSWKIGCTDLRNVAQSDAVKAWIDWP